MRLRLHPLQRGSTPRFRTRTSLSRTSRWPLVAALSLGLVASFGLTSCNSGDDSETPTSSSAPTDDASTAEAQRLDKDNAQVTAHIVQVGRGVKKKQQTAIRRQIAKPIKAWSDAAYLAGDFPHAGYTKQDFPGWTARAAALAARDKDVTTSDFIRKKADQVIADRRDARLFVFSVGGLAGGATAKVYLGMTADLESGKQVRYAVAGQVYLTRKANHWRIFGYDLHRTVLRR